jgi:thymidine phosphorylase
MQDHKHALRLKRLGISTYKEAVVYIRGDSHICKSEGFESQSRLQITYNNKIIIATLHIITSNLLRREEASLSDHAWELLGAKEGEHIYLSHPPALVSRGYVRKKIFGAELTAHDFNEIISNVASGYLSDIEIAAFLTACAGEHLSRDEITYLTQAMLNVGSKMHWDKPLVVDKHCIGGIPGNRTTPIIVPIVAAFGLTIPKTSSRAITSSAGTADTMETLAPVTLTFAEMSRVVEQENGCIVWGDAAKLSPADDVLIRIERVLQFYQRKSPLAQLT